MAEATVPPIDFTWVTQWLVDVRRIVEQIAKITGDKSLLALLPRLDKAIKLQTENRFDLPSRIANVPAIERQPAGDVQRNAVLRRQPEQYILNLLKEQERYYEEEMKWFGALWGLDFAKERVELGRKARGLYALLGASKMSIKQDLPPAAVRNYCKNMREDITKVLNTISTYTTSKWDRKNSGQRLSICFSELRKMYLQGGIQQQYALAKAMYDSMKHIQAQRASIKNHPVPEESFPLLKTVFSSFQNINGILIEIQTFYGKEEWGSVLASANQLSTQFTLIKPETVDALQELLSREFTDVTAFHDALQTDRKALAELFGKDQKEAKAQVSQFQQRRKEPEWTERQEHGILIHEKKYSRPEQDIEDSSGEIHDEAA